MSTEAHGLYMVLFAACGDNFQGAIATTSQAGLKHAFILTEILRFSIGQLFDTVEVANAHAGDNAVKKQSVHHWVGFGLQLCNRIINVSWQ